MRTIRFLRACRVQESDWLHAGFQRSGMIAPATRRKASCKLWEEPRLCSIKAGCTPKRLGEWAPLNPCVTHFISSRGLRPKVSLGPGTLINENALKAKAIR